MKGAGDVIVTGPLRFARRAEGRKPPGKDPGAYAPRLACARDTGLFKREAPRYSPLVVGRRAGDGRRNGRPAGELDSGIRVGYQAARRKPTKTKPRETVEPCCVLDFAGNQHCPPSWVEAFQLAGSSGYWVGHSSERFAAGLMLDRGS